MWTSKALLAAAVCAAALLATGAVELHARAVHVALEAVGFFRTRTLAACAAYAALYVIFSVFCIPLMPLEVLTGFCFGVPFGICLDVIGRLSGACLAFLISRTFLQPGMDFSCMLPGGNAVLRGIGKAVDEQGFRLLLLFNMAHIPAAIKNYGLGMVPEVPLLSFLAATFVVEVPQATIWASIGSAVAVEFDDAGLSAKDVTAMKQALASSSARASWQLKFGIISVGITCLCLIILIIQRKVLAELEKVANPAINPNEADPLLPNRQGGALETNEHAAAGNS